MQSYCLLACRLYFSLYVPNVFPPYCERYSVDQKTQSPGIPITTPYVEGWEEGENQS